jgi:uncharacterized membrane protein YqaE (UPF0057 family)
VATLLLLLTSATLAVGYTFQKLILESLLETLIGFSSMIHALRIVKNFLRSA